METGLKLAIFGADDLVTEALLEAIGNHPTLCGEIRLLGNSESAGTAVEFASQTLLIEEIGACGFDEIDILIASGEAEYRGDWLGRALDAGCVVLDIGAELPGHEQRPVVVAGVNGELIEQLTPGSVLVLPDAATAQCALSLQPLLRQLEIERVTLFSCHAVSERGRAGVEEMARQTAQMLNGKPALPVLFPHQVAFNLLPMDGGEAERPGERERRISDQLGQLLGLSAQQVMVSCCWAPVFYGHSQRLHVTTAEVVELAAVKRIFSRVPYIEGKWESGDLPTAVTHASGSDLLTLGRLSSFGKNTTDFSLWAVADNLRFGIAGNAVKIVELLVKRLFISYS